MNPEQGIIAGGLVILSLGLVKDWVTGTGAPKHVVAGAIGVTVLASLLALGGGQLSRVAMAIVMLAVGTAVLVEGVPLAQALNNATKA